MIDIPYDIIQILPVRVRDKDLSEIFLADQFDYLGNTPGIQLVENIIQ